MTTYTYNWCCQALCSPFQRKQSLKVGWIIRTCVPLRARVYESILVRRCMFFTLKCLMVRHQFPSRVLHSQLLTLKLPLVVSVVRFLTDNEREWMQLPDPWMYESVWRIWICCGIVFWFDVELARNALWEKINSYLIIYRFRLFMVCFNECQSLPKDLQSKSPVTPTSTMYSFILQSTDLLSYLFVLWLVLVEDCLWWFASPVCHGELDWMYHLTRFAT